MPGIFGFVGFEDRNLLNRMGDVIKYNEGDFYSYLDDNVGIGILNSIPINKAGKDQPIYNEDKSICAVFDGEIYNSDELREIIEKSGHKCYTSDDSEVIIHLYEEFGNFFVDKINGVFSIGIWDTNGGKLLLARDKIGIKPLHYILVDKSLLFASQIKSLLQYETVNREVDIQSLHRLLNLRYIPQEATMFKSIKRLLPGHILVYKDDGIHIHKYWDLSIKTDIKKSEEYYANRLFELLRESVSQRIRKAPSLGTFLTGGMDTSSVVAMMRELTDKPIKSFQLSFGEPVKDDQKYARIAADYFETDHHEEVIDPQEVDKVLPYVMWSMDEPNPNGIPPYFAAKLASKHTKVVFTGRGGDELYGGYNRLKYVYLSKDIHKLTPRCISNIISKLVNFQSRYSKLKWDRYNRYLSIISGIGNKERFYISIAPRYIGGSVYSVENIYSKKFSDKNICDIESVFKPYFEDNANADFLNQVLLAEFKEKLVNELIMVDGGMATVHSISERFPFLDTNLVEFSFTIPFYLKMRDRGNTRKYILRKAMSKSLPQSILKRPKGGAFAFGPLYLFEKELRDIASNILPEGSMVKEGYFKRDYINQVLEHASSSTMSPHYISIMAMLCLEIWYKIYIENDNLNKPNLSINNFY